MDYGEVHPNQGDRKRETKKQVPRKLFSVPYDKPSILTFFCLFAIMPCGLCKVYDYCPCWLGILGDRQ